MNYLSFGLYFPTFSDPTTHLIPKMFLNRSEYDRGPNTFSPEGRLFQVGFTS